MLARLWPWLVPAGSVALAFGIHSALAPLMSGTIYMMFHAANFASSWFGGMWQGLAATAAGALLVNLCFLPPATPPFSAPALAGLLLFVSIGVIFALVAESRRRALVAANEASVMRETFISVAGHELRTPLTALQLRLQMLQRKGNDSADLKAALRNSARMDRLVADLLDVGRFRGGALLLERAPVDLGLVAREAAERAAPEGLLEFELEDSVVGNWDRERLDHLVTNLVLNAIKFGQGKPVRVKVSREGQRAVLAVRDQGIGIAAKDQKRIFERFERAVSSTAYGGFGLGPLDLPRGGPRARRNHPAGERGRAGRHLLGGAAFDAPDRR